MILIKLTNFQLKIGQFNQNHAVPYEKILDFSSINDLDTHLITI